MDSMNLRASILFVFLTLPFVVSATDNFSKSSFISTCVVNATGEGAEKTDTKVPKVILSCNDKCDETASIDRETGVSIKPTKECTEKDQENVGCEPGQRQVVVTIMLVSGRETKISKCDKRIGSITDRLAKGDDPENIFGSVALGNVAKAAVFNGSTAQYSPLLQEFGMSKVDADALVQKDSMAAGELIDELANASSDPKSIASIAERANIQLNANLLHSKTLSDVKERFSDLYDESQENLMGPIAQQTFERPYIYTSKVDRQDSGEAVQSEGTGGSIVQALSEGVQKVVDGGIRSVNDVWRHFYGEPLIQGSFDASEGSDYDAVRRYTDLYRSENIDWDKLWPSDKQVLFVGEEHNLVGPKDVVADLIRNGRADVLVLEQFDVDQQDLLNKFSVGDFSSAEMLELVKKTYAWDFGQGSSEALVNMFEQARLNGVRLVAADLPDLNSMADPYSPEIMLERNKLMAATIQSQLAENPDARIIFFGGADHVGYEQLVSKREPGIYIENPEKVPIITINEVLTNLGVSSRVISLTGGEEYRAPYSIWSEAEQKLTYLGTPLLSDNISRAAASLGLTSGTFMFTMTPDASRPADYVIHLPVTQKNLYELLELQPKPK